MDEVVPVFFLCHHFPNGFAVAARGLLNRRDRLLLLMSGHNRATLLCG